MKKLILIIGTLLIVFNTLIGLFISNYAILNFLLVDLSLALSTGLLLFVAYSKIANSFKIGLAVLLFFTCIVRCLCVALTEQVWTNNYYFIAAIGILFFEFACVASAIFASKKKVIIKRQVE